MKVMLVEPYGTRLGHFGLYAAQIGQELSSLGHEVVVVTGTRLPTHKFLESKAQFRIVELGLSDTVLSADSSRLPTLLRKLLYGLSVIWINLLTLFMVVRRATTERFVVIHLLDWEAFSTAVVLTYSRIKYGTRFPLVLIHVNPVDFRFGAHLRNPIRGLYKTFARIALRYIIDQFCWAVTVQGEWHRDRLIRQLGRDKQEATPFEVVRPGTIVPRVTPSPVQARAALKLDADSTIFLFFGMLRRDKGVDILLQAVEKLEGHWQLLIAGSEFHWTAQTLAKRISQIKHLGRIRADIRYIPEEEVETFFAAAGAVVLPYRGKNYLGNYGPMIMACGYGKPLIVSDVGEMGRLVRERGLGFAVTPDDVGALREALQTFINLSAETREQMQARARKVAQEYSFASMARRLADIYSKHSRKTVS